MNHFPFATPPPANTPPTNDNYDDSSTDIVIDWELPEYNNNTAAVQPPQTAPDTDDASPAVTDPTAQPAVSAGSGEPIATTVVRNWGVEGEVNGFRLNLQIILLMGFQMVVHPRLFLSSFLHLLNQVHFILLMTVTMKKFKPDYRAFLSAIDSAVEPNSFKEAVENEMKALTDNNIWTM